MNISVSPFKALSHSVSVTEILNKMYPDLVESLHGEVDAAACRGQSQVLL